MFRLIGLITILVFLQVSSVYADDECNHWSARVTSMQGVVEIRKHANLEWVPAKLNDRLCGSDSLRTASHSRAIIHIQEETFLVLKERSTVRFSSNQENGIFSQLLNLFNGEAYFRSRRPRELGIETPFVNAMHEGTEFLVKVTQDSTQVIVFDGVVVASNALGQVSVAEGQSALTFKGQAPAIGPRIELRDAVQWTLYYPPVIDYTSASKNLSYSTLKPVLDRFQSNDLSGAFEQLDNVSEAERNADYQILYASLLLTVGQVEQAQQHLNLVQQESQKNANVLALQSIIALAKNDQQHALKLAEQAQQVNPQAAAPKIALSYAYQSLFDIDKALDSATQAAQADPNNGLAWARVSEMELATGNVDASMQAASKAQMLNPKLSKTNTVLGFARLASLDLSEADQSFRTAIKRDPSDPLARLGLGLAKIRQGHIKSGTKEMETAANLDPDNALIRSYLGKAYYEQRRGDIASTEYAIAKKLDPNDPTPWFYDAIYKQTVNRPVEALHDIQKAIELNDNRAVYRSKLLLDQDLASRSAALGRIYNDLGFQQRGLVEGWKSANADPGNYSAHRLLADNYAALPRHEIARVSELLQSQLLQPINITPVQPQLAESNLLVVDGLGPQSSSFNEFNPLFARNRFALQGSGVYGSNNTWGEEVTQSGLWNNFSYSLGQFHYQTDGFRKNNDLKQDIYNLFMQTSFSTNTSIQFEYRKKDLSFGDLGLPFDINNIDESIRNSQHSDSVRLGFLHTFTPSSKILGSVIYQDLDIKQRVDFLNTKIKDNGYIGELQYQFTSPVLNSILGIGYFDVDSKTKISFVDELNEPIDDRFKEIIRHTNLYAYANIRLPSDITWTVGLSLDNVNNDLADITKLNPKLGVSWQATPKTLVRLAAFRTLTKDVIQDQTIEPTQVAGFNQYFDELRSITAWRYGAAIDHKFSKHIFSGIEFSQRDLEVPFIEFDVSGSQQVDSADFREQLGRAYFYWTPTKWISTSVAYQFERFTTEQKLADENILDLKTHRVPIQLSLFLPSGLTVRTKATYINQQGNFFNSEIPPDGLVFYDKDKFWVFDTSLSYRLPKRMGLASLEIKNLFNNHFNFQDAIPGRSATSIDQPTIALGRVILGKLTLSF